MEEKELKLEDIFAPMSPFDELSDDEVLYWATPYGLELEEKKQKLVKGQKREEE